MDFSLCIKPLVDVSNGKFCHLLEIGDVRLVIDCGLGPDLQTTCYDSLSEIIESADAILVTSFETSHFGAVHLFRNVPIICSQPTAVLGRIFTDETPNIKTLKFSQPYRIKDLTIYAYNAGYTLGNSIFKIIYGTESISIGYNICHRMEEYYNGASLSAIKDTRLLITNSVYGSIRPCKMSERNEELLRIIHTANKRVVIRVSFSRLFEVLSTLLDTKVTVVSNRAKEFISRISSMVEWAGLHALDILGSMSISYAYPENALKHKIIILPGEDDKYCGAVLQGLTKEDVFVTIDHSISSEEYKKMKIYEFKYEKVKKKKAEKAVSSEEVEVKKEMDVDVHWSAYKSTIFVSGYKRSELFPYIKKKKHNNDYGETFKPLVVAQTKTTKEEEIGEELVEIEHLKLIKQGVEPVFKRVSVDFYGKSDFESFKTVLSSNCISNLVLIPDKPHLAKFMYASIKYIPSVRAKICMQGVVSVPLPPPPKIFTLPPEILDLKFTKISSGCKILRAQVEYKEGGLAYVGKSSPLFFGSLDKNKVRSALLQNGMCVRIAGEALDVNNKVCIRFERGGISISGEDETTLMAVRNIIYSFIVMV